jgi:hypothetical protein
VLGGLVAALVIVFTRDNSPERALPLDSAATDPGPIHVHGLGINPKDGALFIATHTGLWRTRPGETRAERVSDHQQDTMGFTMGRTWALQGQAERTGLLAWPRSRTLYLVTPSGAAEKSSDGGRRWTTVGDVRGEPAALLAQTPRELYVALHDGTVKRSDDGGRTWTIRSSP